MAIIKSNKRAAEKAPVGAGAHKVKRVRLRPRKGSSSSTSSSNEKALPSTTKWLEMPNGEFIEVSTDAFPRHLVKDPSKHWTSDAFTLNFPALRVQCTPLLTYTWVYERDPYEESTVVFRPTCWPNAPEDTITKKLFVHKNHRKIVYAGEWAEAKLKAEIQRYERVKWFWLFNDGYAYLHGYDSKYKYAAKRFQRELESQWVVFWLSELIGEEEVAKVLACMEKKKKE